MTTERILTFPEKVGAWPIQPSDVAKVRGNAPYNSKRICLGIMQVLLSNEFGETFSKRVSEHIEVVEVAFIENPEDSRKKEARVVCEIEVNERLSIPSTPGHDTQKKADMVGADGNLHTGCVVLLVDVCSALPLTVYREAIGDGTPDSGVSQSINTAFHLPASLGTKLRIVNTTMVTQPPILCARTQIWDIDKVRLIASGTQLKMFASEPKTKL
ncbi:hypothetical protein ONZ45_g11783 [Pleurotus djamor]|nr:hypothetical protein ONZ45_g11783 [Pleurotus djamor]